MLLACRSVRLGSSSAGLVVLFDREQLRQPFASPRTNRETKSIVFPSCLRLSSPCSGFGSGDLHEQKLRLLCRKRTERAERGLSLPFPPPRARAKASEFVPACPAARCQRVSSCYRCLGACFRPTCLTACCCCLCCVVASVVSLPKGWGATNDHPVCTVLDLCLSVSLSSLLKLVIDWWYTKLFLLSD